MSLKSLEAAILKEARQVTGRKSLRRQDILEWSTGKVTVNAGERQYALPELSIDIVIKE